MQLSSVNDVKIYNLSHGKSLPEVRTVFSVVFNIFLARKPRYMLIKAKRASIDSSYADNPNPNIKVTNLPKWISFKKIY